MLANFYPTFRLIGTTCAPPAFIACITCAFVPWSQETLPKLKRCLCSYKSVRNFQISGNNTTSSILRR